jgi:hypothetical protein
MVACNLHINEHHCTTEKSNKLFLGEDSGLIDEINIFFGSGLVFKNKVSGLFCTICQEVLDLETQNINKECYC